MIFLITYDLKKPGRDYSSLYETIKSAKSWWHYLDSTWLIYSNETVTVNEWSEKIRNVIDANDLFLIVDITNQPRQGWLKKQAWEWIREKEQL
jgi:hypothetical protein